MSNRLNSEREAKLQPQRIEKAIKDIEDLGFEINERDGTKIVFEFYGHDVTYFPYSGWATGKSIKDGRGLQNLLKQLKK